jgi:hypothetical protein
MIERQIDSPSPKLLDRVEPIEGVLEGRWRASPGPEFRISTRTPFELSSAV